MSTLPDFTGPGFFAGEAPDGLTTVVGTPQPAEVRVYWRDPADPEAEDVLVASTLSASNGTWRIDNLNPELQYVVRGRKAGFDDVTVVGATPSRTDVIAVEDHLQPTAEFDGLDGYVLMDSGLTPFTATVIDPLPFGLAPVMDGRKLLISGTSDDEGLWSSSVRVTSSNGVFVDVPVEVQIQPPSDPHWDKVVALLHLDGDLADQKPRVWTPAVSAEYGAGGLAGSLGITRGITTAYSADLDVIGADFTIEFFVKAASWDTWGRLSSGRYISRAFGKMAHNGGANYWSVGPNNTGHLMFYAYNNNVGVFRGSTAAVALNQLTHVAFMRQGNNILASIAGVVEVLGSVGALNLGPSHVFSLGRHDSVQCAGLIDEVRVTKGLARYTSNFVPPVQPFLHR